MGALFNWLGRLAMSVLTLALPTQCVQMCDQSALWRGCKRSYSVPDVVDGGYNFGWEPYSQLREMCRLRSHVNVLKCLHHELTHQCSERKNYIALLTILNHRMYEAAADYICEDQNVVIFEQSIDCLKRFLPEARACSHVRSITATIVSANARINQAINDTNERTQTIRTDKEALLKFIERTFEEQLCADRKIFSGCLERQFLRDKQLCSDPIVMLLMKYYSYLIPEWCRHPSPALGSYSQQHQQQPMADQRSREAESVQQRTAQSGATVGVSGGDSDGSGGGVGVCGFPNLVLALTLASAIFLATPSALLA